MNSVNFWSIYAGHITDFVSFKRSLGFKFNEEERILHKFDQFVIGQGEIEVGLSKELADKWSVRTNNESERTRYARVRCISQFSGYLRSIGIKSYIPQLPKYPDSGFIPHIFTYKEMNALFKACDNLVLRVKDMGSSIFVMPCLMRMLYATGIRIGEALSLKNENVNLAGKYLVLKEVKNGKERLVPFSNTLSGVCQEYLVYRNRLPVVDIDKNDHPFFVTLNGNYCRHSSIYRWFRKILKQAGIPFTGNRQGPRVHDIRHTFACHSFVRLSDEELDIYCSWPYLSAYMGHKSLKATEQYVRLTAQIYPDLLKGADRLYVDIFPDNN